MNRLRCCLFVLIGVALLTLGESQTSAAQTGSVYFDLAPTVPARPDKEDPSVVTVKLRLSSMIASPSAPRVDQWLVRVVPRDRSISIADYAPRTATTSDMASSIQIKRTKQESDAVGISIVGGYGRLAEGNAGLDHTQTHGSTVQYDRIAPEFAVTASGTIHRGKGVYFKLRWTAQQVLEGDKTFQVSMQVGRLWRAGLIDVSVVAQTDSTSTLVPWDRKPKTIGSADFVVAAFRQGDQAAETLAGEVAAAEHELHQLAAGHADDPAAGLFAAMFRRVTTTFDTDASRDREAWVERVLQNTADPHVDKHIKRLPMTLRVAVLDYIERRDQLALINETNQESMQRDAAL